MERADQRKDGEQWRSLAGADSIELVCEQNGNDGFDGADWALLLFFPMSSFRRDIGNGVFATVLRSRSATIQFVDVKAFGFQSPAEKVALPACKKCAGISGKSAANSSYRRSSRRVVGF